MFVRKRMTAQTAVVAPDSPVRSAYQLMKASNYEGLPVVAGKELAGVITMWDIMDRACCSPADYMDRTLVKELMVDKVITIGEGDIIEEAAFLMYKHDIGLLPVVSETGALVGIITESDLFKTFVHMLGLGARGTRITVRVEDRVGKLAQVAEVIRRAGVNIVSVATFEGEGGHYYDIVFRVSTEEPKHVVDKLMEAKFRVTHVSQVWR
ncbi:MAG: CBS domain-containing protein [Bacillota bacterium]